MALHAQDVQESVGAFGRIQGEEPEETMGEIGRRRDGRGNAYHLDD
jgi:hypothetical protein